MTAVLRLDNLAIQYAGAARPALEDLSLVVGPGDAIWLAGATGAGCTTLLLAAAGFAPRLTGGSRRGSVEVLGHDPAVETRTLAGRLALLGASPAAQLSGVAATVEEEVAFGPANLGWARTRIDAAVAQALARTGVQHLAARAPTTLSGGELQRVVLAASLVLEPALWLLDEPLSALDPDAAEGVLRVLRDELRRGAAVLLATDDAEVARRLTTRTVVLQDGRLAAEGPTALLLASDALFEAGAAGHPLAQLALAARAFGARRDAVAPYPLDADEAARRWQRVASPPSGVLINEAALQLSLIGDDLIMPAAAPTARVRPNTAGPVLQFDQVHFGYGGTASSVLAGLSLLVTSGEGVALLGANGAGKSTTLRLAMALAQPTAGEVQTVNVATTGLGPEDFASRVGFVFQHPEDQLFAASVREELAFGPRQLGWSPSQIQLRMDEVLALLELEATAARHPYDLPAPARRLVTVACALMARPALLLLDEPSAGLDAASRALLVAAVRAVRRAGTAVVAVTHDPSFAAEALDRGLVLRGGRVVADAPLGPLLARSGGDVPALPAPQRIVRDLGLLPKGPRFADAARALAGHLGANA